MESTTQARNLVMYTGCIDYDNYIDNKKVEHEGFEPLDYVAGCGDFHIFNGKDAVEPKKVAFYENNKRNSSGSLQKKVETYFSILKNNTENGLIFKNEKVLSDSILETLGPNYINCFSESQSSGSITESSWRPEIKSQSVSYYNAFNLYRSRDKWYFATLRDGSTEGWGVPRSLELNTNYGHNHTHSISSSPSFNINLNVYNKNYALRKIKSPKFNFLVYISNMDSFPKNNYILTTNTNRINKRLRKYLQVDNNLSSGILLPSWRDEKSGQSFSASVSTTSATVSFGNSTNNSQRILNTDPPHTASSDRFWLSHTHGNSSNKKLSTSWNFSNGKNSISENDAEVKVNKGNTCKIPSLKIKKDLSFIPIGSIYFLDSKTEKTKSDTKLTISGAIEPFFTEGELKNASSTLAPTLELNDIQSENTFTLSKIGDNHQYSYDAAKSEVDSGSSPTRNMQVWQTGNYHSHSHSYSVTFRLPSDAKRAFKSYFNYLFLNCYSKDFWD